MNQKHFKYRDSEIEMMTSAIVHDSYDRCGEIFMTTRKNLIFYCTLCKRKYKEFNEYENHLSEHFLLLPPDPDSICFEDTEIKTEQPSEPKFESSNSRLYEEGNITTKKLPESSIKDSSDEDTAEAYINNDCNIDILEDNDFFYEECKKRKNDSKNEPQECRPVRKKTNYLQQANELRKFKCNICPAAFKDRTCLRKHVERHSTQKSHQCPQCPKKFYTPFDVKKHLNVHRGDRLFLCTICGRTCLSNSKLNDHMRRHTNQRDYKCSHCKKGFYNASLLTEHLQAHSTERRHKCSVCNANFTYRKGLRNHMKLHENKRNYKCELCSASFNQQAGLFSHMKNKHKTV